MPSVRVVLEASGMGMYPFGHPMEVQHRTAVSCGGQVTNSRTDRRGSDCQTRGETKATEPESRIAELKSFCHGPDVAGQTSAMSVPKPIDRNAAVSIEQ